MPALEKSYVLLKVKVSISPEFKVFFKVSIIQEAPLTLYSNGIFFMDAVPKFFIAILIGSFVPNEFDVYCLPAEWDINAYKPASFADLPIHFQLSSKPGLEY